MIVQEIAWAAGLFDGEGCVTISRSNPARSRSPDHQLRVTLGMCHEATIAKMKQMFGGSMSMRRSKAKGWRDHWVWCLASYPAANFLGSIYPYLITKKYEAWLGREFQATRTLFGGGPTHFRAEEEIALREGFRLALQEAKRGILQL